MESVVATIGIERRKIVDVGRDVVSRVGVDYPIHGRDRLRWLWQRHIGFGWNPVFIVVKALKTIFWCVSQLKTYLVVKFGFFGSERGVERNPRSGEEAWATGGICGTRSKGKGGTEVGEDRRCWLARRDSWERSKPSKSARDRGEWWDEVLTATTKELNSGPNPAMIEWMRSSSVKEKLMKASSSAIECILAK